MKQPSNKGRAKLEQKLSDWKAGLANNGQKFTPGIRSLHARMIAALEKELAG